MSAIVLLDTSVFLNILDVPGNNQDRDSIFEEFEKRLGQGDYFLLPMATIWETGNHIADLESGGRRFQYAKKLLEEVSKAMSGDAPYRSTYFPSSDEFLTWLVDFPKYAKRSKTEKKSREGISLSDLSIIKEWEQVRKMNSMSQVLIWSLDADLASYDTGP